MQKYIYGDVLLYAREHTIKETQEFFCFPSYEATKRYLLKHNIKHLAESRTGRNNPNYRHGGKHTRLYTIWCGMKNRCYNKNDSHYPRWGGRGVQICSEWLLDFINFQQWALHNGYADNLTIDRINNDGTALRTCSVCGFAYGTTSTDIESCSHVYTRTVINELTCFADGIYQYICDYCDDSYTEIEKTTGHNYKTTVIRPTATKPGYSIHECERCGDSYTDNHTDAAGNPANMGNNRIIGISDGAVYAVGETITFRAIGDGMDDTDDIYSTRFIPASWSVNPSGVWTSAPYTATFTIENVGSYTLSVKFREEKFQNGEWVETGLVNEKTIRFSVVEKSISGGNTPPYVPPIVTEKPMPDSPSNPSNPSTPVVTVTTSATTVTEEPDEEITEPEEETDEPEEEIMDTEEDTDTTKPAEDEEDDAESEEETSENEEADGNPVTGVLVSFGGVIISLAALVITKKKH